MPDAATGTGHAILTACAAAATAFLAARQLHVTRHRAQQLIDSKGRSMQKRLATLALAMVLTPALAMAQKTSYDFDKTANFTGFKTYALKDGTKVGQPLIDDRIVNAIDTELAAKGFTKSDANPDVFVVYHVAFDKQKDISTFSSGYGGGYGGVRLGIRWRLGGRRLEHHDGA